MKKSRTARTGMKGDGEHERVAFGQESAKRERKMGGGAHHAGSHEAAALLSVTRKGLRKAVLPKLLPKET